jgi:hypothetical protein
MRLAIVTLTAAALLAVPAASRADRRYYGVTYNAATAPPGSLDVEPWVTYSKPPHATPGEPSLWRYQLEVETGITERWDIAAYGVWRQVVGEDPRFDAVKLESRYALAAPGTWFVDPVVYVELQKSVLDDKPFSVEEKLILAKDLGRLNVSLNGAAEQEFVGGDVAPEYSYALGASWEFVPAFRLGAEIFGDRAKLPTASGVETFGWQAWAGPALSLAYGRAWLVLAAGWGLNDRSDEVQARGIFAFQF